MNNSLSSKQSRVGDKFTATVVVPVHVNGQMAIPAGSMIEGRITQVMPAKRMSRAGTIAVGFDQLVLPDGRALPIDGSLTSDDPYTRRHIDDESRISGEKGQNPVVFIGGGGAMGAILGGITGGMKGAAVGGAIGAGVGVARILWAKGEEAQVPAGTPFGVQLRQAMNVPADAGGSVASDPYGGRDRDPSYRDPSYTDPSNRDRDPSYRDPSYRDPAPRDNSGRDSGPVGRDSNRQPETSTPIGGSSSSSSSADREPPQPATPENEEANPPEPEPEPEPPVSLASAEGVKRAQLALKEQGYYEGQIDGEMTPRTTSALKTYQREHKLPETGQLDEATARSLGIIGRSADAKSTARRDPAPSPREPSSRRADSPGSAGPSRGVVAANVLGASALRQSDGSIYISIDTQADTGGWRWYGEHAINGETLEVFAKAVPPTGTATQAVTRGRIELKLMDRVERVRRVVVHSSGADRSLTLDGAPSRAATEPATTSAPVNLDSARNLQRQAETLFADYQRICGVRMTAGSVDVGGSGNNDPEIELLFALDGFVKSSQLYTRLLPSLRDNARKREATLSLARQGRVTDRVVATSSARCAQQLLPAWDEIRQLVLELMRSYGITADDIEP
jgi:peptidoglycan hydrolase-like protein with peptidoglycan-binding domain